MYALNVPTSLRTSQVLDHGHAIDGHRGRTRYGVPFAFPFDPGGLRRVGPMKADEVLARGHSQVHPELRRVDAVAIDLLVLGPADIHAATSGPPTAATVSAPNPSRVTNSVPGRQALSLGIHVVIATGVAKDKPLWFLWATARTETRIAGGRGVLGGINLNQRTASQGILLPAHDDLQFVGTVRQALLHKQGLPVPNRRIPALHHGRLFHPINERIRPAAVRPHLP